MNLSIVIPTFNRKEYLKVLLSQLYNQKGNGFELEIVVVVDGSTDGTFEMLERDFPEVHIVKGTGNWWYTKSMNEGFKKAEKLKPDYLLALNDDIEIDDIYIKNLISPLKNLKEPCIIGSTSCTLSEPHQIIDFGTKKIDIFGRLITYYKPRTLTEIKRLNGLHECAVLPGRGLLIHNKILKRLNYFDETFKQYLSDNDFCLRANNEGYKCFINWDSKLYSHTELTSKSSSCFKKSFSYFVHQFINPYSRQYIPSRVRYYLRHFRFIQFPIIFSFFILSNIKNYIKPKSLD